MFKSEERLPAPLARGVAPATSAARATAAATVALCAEAVGAVDGPVAPRLEGYGRFLATLGTGGLEHLARPV